MIIIGRKLFTVILIVGILWKFGTQQIKKTHEVIDTWYPW